MQQRPLKVNPDWNVPSSFLGVSSEHNVHRPGVRNQITRTNLLGKESKFPEVNQVEIVSCCGQKYFTVMTKCLDAICKSAKFCQLR